ncbi:GNAT family N-acetyltransferase [Paenibacillus jilunlii]|uniref:Acetyltransferase (GNAT) domain-containing protein n=1 Tax=Paenibacillus jilunlii TaxID=682956 RepID=A0A1G9KPG9_9BACL|nr:GNAT family N-acetyltransferase [Paenibacillus jilunlii]KWX69871.1 GCN5 family acetyltransferase [Paenibacillus jilunlii]SDL51377.1 Acetyltransferase (GNAT) domain-containing protein [Paenibacillus jilunlii]
MITVYDDSYKEEVIKLIMHVQNVEYEVGISVKEQPDILDIHSNYINDGGNFWIALNDNGEVVGSIGLQRKTKGVAVLKKFFVYKDYRGKEFGTGKKLYEALLDFAKKQGFSKIILDTPSKATRSHGFYNKVGFKEIDKEDLPIKYDYPDRNSIIFLLEL